MLVVDDDVELPRGFLDRLPVPARSDSGSSSPSPRCATRATPPGRVCRRERWTVARRTRMVEIGPVIAFHRSVAAELLPVPARCGWAGGSTRTGAGWRGARVAARRGGRDARSATRRARRRRATTAAPPIAELAEFLGAGPTSTATTALEVLERHRALRRLRRATRYGSETARLRPSRIARPPHLRLRLAGLLIAETPIVRTSPPTDSHGPQLRILSRLLVARAGRALVRSRRRPPTRAPTSVIRDCSEDGVLDGNYSHAELDGALDQLPSDLDEYTDCRSVIRRAQLGSPAASAERQARGVGRGRVDRPRRRARRGAARSREARRGPPARCGSAAPGVRPGRGGRAVRPAGFGTDLPPLVLIVLLVARRARSPALGPPLALAARRGRRCAGLARVSNVESHASAASEPAR